MFTPRFLPSRHRGSTLSASRASGHEDRAPATVCDRGAVSPLMIAGIAGAGLVLAYGGAVLWSSGDVARGTTVMGVDIGGKTPDEAVALLKKELADDVSKDFKAKAGEAEVTLRPADVGLTVDWSATVGQASGTNFNPITLIKALSSRDELPLVVAADPEKLKTEMSDLAEQLNSDPTEPSVAFKGSAPVLQKGVPGAELDQEAAASAVSDGWLKSQSPIVLPVGVVKPKISDEAVTEVIDSTVKPGVAKPMVVQVGGTPVTIAPAAIAKAMQFTEKGDTLEVSIDGTRLHEAMVPKLAPLEKVGRNASFSIASGVPKVVPAVTGTEVDPEGLGAGVLARLAKTSDAERTFDAAVKVRQPELSTAQAEALNIREKLGSYKQRFPFSSYRKTNVSQAGRYINGTILKPGEIYSMNKTIKQRTPANGYVEGIYIEGGRFRMGQGGGVSIITTATWSTAFYSGLKAIEVNPHGLYINRYQPGLEATVAWGSLDLKFQNDTGNGVLMTTAYGDDFVEITMWGTKKYDKVRSVFGPRTDLRPFTTIVDPGADCVPMVGSEGFKINVTRQFIRGGAVVKSEVFTTRYKPTNSVTCTNPDAGV